MNDPQGRREFLENQPWGEIFPKAVLYAARRLEFYEWQGSWKGGPPMGKTAEDFVNDIITDLYQGGGRDWDHTQHPNFLTVLCGMVKSEISNALRSKENKETVCEAALAVSKQTSAPLDTIPHPSNATDASLLIREKETEDDQWLIDFMSHIEDDKELMEVMSCKLNGIFKPAEIAKSMGIDEQKMENLQKRWKRRLENFQKKNGIKPKMRSGGKERE